ncbi:MAG TPA: ABC transporter ATP-binding protein [Candidatus Margulisiibacteriota bacterium]|nr:ABC transporter ATP-binding protein [Candidatus Margulisiibacteriota bacterium]
MRLLRIFARAYPWRTAVMLGCLLLAGLAEGASLAGLLPLLGIVAGGGSVDAGGALGSSWLNGAVVRALHAVGLPPTAEVLLALIIGGTALKAGLGLLANRQVGYSVAHFATDLRLALIRALLTSRWDYYVHAPLGSFVNAVASEAARASDAYLRATTILMLLIQTALYAGVALLVSWPATLAALLGGALMVSILHQLIRVSRRAGARQTKLGKSLLLRLTDSLRAVKPLKAMGRERLLGPLLESEARRLNRALELEVLSKAAMRALQEPLIVVVLAAGVYGALSILAVPLATIIMLVLLCTRILDCFGKLQRELQDLVAAESALDSLQALIRQTEAAREIKHAGAAPSLRHEVRLDAVQFAYDGTAVLRDASLVVPVGQLTVITGPSGAGKTTIADLVIGLIDPRHGAVLIDGVPLSAVDLAQWRSMIGYVPQDALLMHDSIATNITLGDPSLTAADVDAALRAAGAHDFVAALPDGVETVVGERGLRLSGGQRQRIALARALARRPALLILDEATTALDRDTELGICDTFRRLRDRVTILAICHQGHLLAIADRVYRIDSGTVVPVQLRPAYGTAAAGA